MNHPTVSSETPAPRNVRATQSSIFWSLVMDNDTPDEAGDAGNESEGPCEIDLRHQAATDSNGAPKKQTSEESAKPDETLKKLDIPNKKKDTRMFGLCVEQTKKDPEFKSPKPNHKIPPDMMSELNEDEQAAAILMSMGNHGFGAWCLPPDRRERLLRDHDAEMGGGDTDDEKSK